MYLHSTKIITTAMGLLRQFGYFVDQLWHVNDVHLICEQKNLPKISDAEAMEVFAIMGDNFDGDSGISWSALDKALHTYIERKKLISTMLEIH